MSLGDIFPIENSNMFKEWQLEKLEIEKIRWTESQKEGHDIGWERAEWIWMTKHRFQWKTMMKTGVR